MKAVERRQVSPELSRDEVIRAFGPNVEFEKQLAPFTSYRTGGPAKYYLLAESADAISKAIKTAIALKLPYFVVGGGSNLLISDSGYDGLIIKVAVKGLEINGDGEIDCGAGESLQALVDFATENSLTGLEFAAGIWGSVGGAIYGNAGAYGGEIKDVLTHLTLIDQEGNVKEVSPDYCRFAYRDSYLKVTHEVAVRAQFRLQKGEQGKIRAKVNEIIATRSARHPLDGTCGCFFKNIPDPKEKFGKLPAGRLLEQVGAIGMTYGGAAVFEKHANMIVNTGNATSQDIRSLADILKQKVFDRFHILLEEEVIQLGDF